MLFWSGFEEPMELDDDADVVNLNDGEPISMVLNTPSISTIWYNQKGEHL